MNQKGFAVLPILLILVVVLFLVYIVGLYLFKKLAPKLDIPPASKQIVIPASKIDETANWKTYTNTEYGYSLKYPSLLNQNNEQKSDTYLDLVSLKGFEPSSDWLSVTVRKSSLQEEVSYQKSQIEGQVEVKLTQETATIVSGFPGVVLDYSPDQPEVGTATRFAIVNNGKYSYIISGATRTLDQILSTFKFD